MRWKRRKIGKKRRWWRKLSHAIKTSDPMKSKYHRATFALAV